MKWLNGLLLVYLWGWVINQLRPDWAANPQYGYGWFVPFLTVYLLWKRWLNRPAPQPSSHAGWVVALLCVLGAIFLPVRVVLEANADWRLMSWLLTSMAFGFTLSLILLSGGWVWLRHFLFPLLFFFTAVPWPHETEQSLVQSLMRVVASSTVELLTFVGIPALQAGNLIEVGSGIVGIDEACSGVRSLQSTLMASLFLGELYRFKWGRRLGLIVIGLLLAFLLNVMRSFALAFLGARDGLHTLERYHDQAGFTILLACFFLLWGLAVWLERKRPSPSRPAAVVPAARPLPAPLLISAACVFLAAEISVSAWYRSRESKFVENATWSVRWPETRAAYEPITLDEATRKAIGADEGGAGAWLEADGSRWKMYYFRWLPGSVLSRILARTHRPEHCLPAAGRALQEDRGIRSLVVHGLNIPFRSLVFDNQGKPLHVFFCLWEDQVSTEAPEFLRGYSPSSGRIKAVLEGQRRMLGQQTLEFVVSGCSDPAQAEESLKRIIGEIIVPKR